MEEAASRRAGFGVGDLADLVVAEAVLFASLAEELSREQQVERRQAAPLVDFGDLAEVGEIAIGAQDRPRDEELARRGVESGQACADHRLHAGGESGRPGRIGLASGLPPGRVAALQDELHRLDRVEGMPAGLGL